MIYNHYAFTMTKKKDETKERWHGWATGSTVEEAIQHADFWHAEGDKLGEDFDILETRIKGTSTEYPYEDEDIMRRAFANKEDTIARIEAAGMSDLDKHDLKLVVEKEDAATFNVLPTACRDWFWYVMED